MGKVFCFKKIKNKKISIYSAPTQNCNYHCLKLKRIGYENMINKWGNRGSKFLFNLTLPRKPYQVINYFSQLFRRKPTINKYHA